MLAAIREDREKERERDKRKLLANFVKYKKRQREIWLGLCRVNYLCGPIYGYG